MNKKIVIKSNNRERVGLTSVELSHLHQQLQGDLTCPACRPASGLCVCHATHALISRRDHHDMHPGDRICDGVALR